MKYRGILLLAIAGLSAMAIAGSASATTFTSPAGTVYTGDDHAVSEGHMVFNSPFFNLECNVTVEMTITGDGTAPNISAVSMTLTMHLTNCTNGYTMTVIQKGSTEYHSIGNGNATVTGNGTEITATTPLGFNCIYKTNKTDIGVLTGSKTTGGTARLDVSAAIPRTGHSAFCGSSATWTGSLKFTSPDYLSMD